MKNGGPAQQILGTWDDLIVTASNEMQAAAYESQLHLRRKLGLLAGVQNVMAVADPGGRRIGSGGSTLWCLLHVLARELESEADRSNHDKWREVLAGRRILILHAGGDSRRLPAYGPCGKVFVPLPGENDSALPVTLFDRQLPVYLDLPRPAHDGGQIVITSGDVLLAFDPAEVRFNTEGVTALGCYASPERARNHGVLCAGENGRVRLFLQKPTPAEQRQAGAIDPYDQVILDIGVMNFDANTAVSLLKTVDAKPSSDCRQAFSSELGEAILLHGLDFYREICCGLGAGATLDHYLRSVKQSGSRWTEEALGRLFGIVSSIPFSVDLLPHCRFLDFGVSQNLVASGRALLQLDRGGSHLRTCLDINNAYGPRGLLKGSEAWVEGCRVDAEVNLGGDNLLTGAEIGEPMELPRGACLDVVPIRTSDGALAWCARCYGVEDRFKDSVEQGATFCNLPILEWLQAAGAGPNDVWDASAGETARQSVWDARLFPRLDNAGGHREWLWMFCPSAATDQQRSAWRTTERYSLSQIAGMADHEVFHHRRIRTRAERIRTGLREMWRHGSGFSAAELAFLITGSGDAQRWVADVLTEARMHEQVRHAEGQSIASLVFPRIIHTLGTSLLTAEALAGQAQDQPVAGLLGRLSPGDWGWLESVGLRPGDHESLRQWAGRARNLAFDALGRTILTTESDKGAAPRSDLRSDEIVWGRAPARFDTGGGWTDTPPYSLEHGGCVLNIAINLNGQPPIQAYARVIDEPVIRIGSIDLGTRIQIDHLDQLVDYRQARSEFSLAKAALSLAGLSRESFAWPQSAGLREILQAFGGGIELTTLAAIPKGSGLGTSSIMGAVILAVINRVMGRTLSQRELFHGVLRLEQALTTGGGWQDQIGGAVAGAKLIDTRPGLVPDARIHYVPTDVIDPRLNGGTTVLYYTGITRLAKDILQQVVGRYLDRDRLSMSTLRQIHAIAPRVADAMSRKDLAEYGRLIDAAWRLNKQLDPNSSNDEVEALLARVRPYVHGAKLLGAGGGGFLLMVCKSPADAQAIRDMLQSEPPNDRARFFDFDVNSEGLVVTVC